MSRVSLYVSAKLGAEDRRILAQPQGKTLREIIDRNLERKKLGLPLDLSFRALVPAHAKDQPTVH